MSNTVLESFILIRDISTNKYLKFTTRTKYELELELEMEARGSFYSDGICSATYHQAVRFYDLNKLDEMFGWLDSINPNRYEKLQVTVNANRAT